MNHWIHIIGIAGVTTSGIAVMFKDMGWKVTGSDKGFFPPVSTFLEQHGIKIQTGFKPDRLSDGNTHPDLVLFQGTKGSSNPEYIKASELGLKIMTYPELLQEYVLKAQGSVVVSGTYGKTTVSSALSKMLSTTYETSWMFGGLAVEGQAHVKARTESTKFSVIEGDEYLISIDDKRSKFFLYEPRYLILTAVAWDHPDLFPTKQEYLDNFAKLIALVPDDGVIVANAEDKDLVELVSNAKCKVVYFAANPAKSHTTPHWTLTRESKPLPCFIFDGNYKEIIPYERQLIGDFNEDNLLAATAMAHELGIKKEAIQESIVAFKGIKRRLEIIYESDTVTLIDDFGSSPPKAAGSLAALRVDYPDAQIITIFEPNTGNRTTESIGEYKNAFKETDELIFPRFTRLPKSSTQHLDATQLADALLKEYSDIRTELDDTTLVDYLAEQAISGSEQRLIIVFMGSHSFRNMITQLAERLNEEEKN